MKYYMSAREVTCFVYVCFQYGPKEYCYLAEHDVYAEGDKVVAPVGIDGKTVTDATSV